MTAAVAHTHTIAVGQIFDETDALAHVRRWIEDNPEALAAAGGELPPELAALLDEFEGPFNDLRAREAAFIKELRLAVDNVRLARKALADRIATMSGLVDGFEARLKEKMRAAGVKRVENAVAWARLQGGSWSVHQALTQDELLAIRLETPRFVRVVPERLELDARAVIEANALGEPIPAGVTVTKGETLVIG